MAACLFCKIAASEIPAKELYRDEDVIAIADISPQAPTHALVIPVAHHDDIGALADANDQRLLARLMEVATRIGRESGNGYRIVMNTGEEGGQTVPHLHLHVLAGRRLSWPPG
jgi:histidine triad (HIT) family protein